MLFWEKIKNYKATPYLISLAYLLCCWLFRSYELDGGDSDQWMRETEGGIWFRKREMLSFFMFQAVYQITNRLWHWDGRLTINLVSCLAGAIFIFFLYKLCIQLKKGWIPFSLVMTTGMTVLFFGHIETYAQVVAASMVFFYYLIQYLEHRVDARYPAFFYSLAAMFHLQASLLFPVIPVAWYLNGRKKQDIIHWIFGLLPFGLFWLAIRLGIGEGELFNNIYWVTFTPRPDRQEPYWLFSRTHVYEFVWFLYRIAAITTPMLIVLVYKFRKKIVNEPTLTVLLIASIILFVFMFFYYPHKSFADWDLFSLYGLPSTLLVGYLLLRVNRAKEITVILLVISLGVISPIIIKRAKLGQRGTGTIIIKNVPEEAIVLLDDYLKKPEIYYVLQGKHTVRVLNPPKQFKQEIEVIPNQTVVIEYPFKEKE
ncbi:MAG: hypothetical protein N3A72_03990 [bacterium]|nr:hypothetical protein [bacterium]